MIDSIDTLIASNFICQHPFQYKFPYQPDDYQTRAFYRILQNEHVFVSVPTGAGKTTVAEFAIAKCITEGKNVIYTAPIKALCNQKFYDFQLKFNHIQTNQPQQNDYHNEDDEDFFYTQENHTNQSPNHIGILTGDVKENENAPCLVMTTEVLRNMIFRKNTYLNNVEWIVFDEVHYISNEERGQVWEEVIQWAPEHVRFIFLSATSPNRHIFCKWVSDCRNNQPVWIQEHSKRPIPLDFWIYFGNPSILIDDKLSWNNGWLQLTNETPQSAPRKLLEISHKNFMKKDRNGWTDLIHKLEQQNMLPAVFFGFQKRRLESYAQMTGHMSLTTKKQQYKIHKFLKETFNRLQLTEEHQMLPQVRMITPLLLNGIGFHHSGLLPFLKEIVEVLFAHGLLKILWATETFAMGLNMPTRSVVFTDIRKWDGKKERLLDPSEWLQMAGRAGRRGFDTVGYVIVPADEKISEMNELLWAAPKPMKSHFEASFSTILHSTTDDEHTNMKSFRDYLNADEIQNKHELVSQYKQLLRETDAKYPNWSNKPIVEQFQKMNQLIQLVQKKSIQNFHKMVLTNQSLLHKHILVMPDEFRLYPVLCVVEQWKPTRMVRDTELDETFELSISDVFAVCNPERKINKKAYGKIPFDILDDIHKVWDLTENITPTSFPIEDIEAVQDYMNRTEELQKLRITIGEEDPDVLKKKDWLREMKYLDDIQQLTMKGKIAREIHSTHPILLTECLLNSTFIQAAPEVCVSILSNFTVPRKNTGNNFDEKQTPIPAECQEMNTFLDETVRNCIEKEDKYGLQSKETEIWFDTYTTEHQGVFYLFAKGCSFYEWVRKTGWEEGLLIRWAMRTEEMCRELSEIFERIGNQELREKCLRMQLLIKRDLIETRSIYW